MKKAPLFICLFLLINLSAQNSTTDKLVGKWKLLKETENGEEFTTECTKKTTVEFLENGTYSIIQFVEESEIDDTCTSELRNGKWKNIGNSEYTFNDKITTEIIFEKDTYYYISKIENFTMKYVYRRIE